MVRVPSLVVLLGLTLCVFPSHETVAQQFSESGVVYEAARNKIGLLRYCRNHELLDPAIADQAVTAVATELRKLRPNDSFVREQGDRAQQAGEDGFWEAGRKRDIAGVATLFRTTPADLCREWADETLRSEAAGRPGEVTTIVRVPPVQPLPQAEPTPVEPISVDRQPARASAVVVAARSAPPPPLPEKAPLPPTEAELASVRGALPASGHLAFTGTAASWYGCDTSP